MNFSGWGLDDLPFLNSEENKQKLWNILNLRTQNLANEWGFSDTVFKDEAFTEICNKIFHMTPEEYYKSDVFNDWIKNNRTIEIRSKE